MNWNDLNQPVSKEQRQALYKFLVGRPDVVKNLLRHLTQEEARLLLDGITNADDRLKGKTTRAQKTIAEAEMDALLT
jgi:hypothetical protein